MESFDQDYLSVYRLFFDDIYKSLDLAADPLPVHIGKYNVAEFEIVGEIICWCLEYLNIRKCPPSLIAPLCRSVVDEMQVVLLKDREGCGYRQEEDDYQTLKLMQMTIQKLIEVCSRYRDNFEVSRLPPPPPVPPSISDAAVKNGRRTMEDSHIVINDLHALFGIEGYGVASYYAVFDGHIGSDAAIYSCSHVYQYLVESPYYPQNPEAAFKEAFIKTDERFIKKSNKENLKSGTTAVSVLIRHDLGKLYVAWVGDSQAILVNGREFIQLVNPHRPELLEERERIEKMGGSVVFWGTWRVNGQLAVSRAIGDVDYKPYVTAEADVCSYELTGDEDFLLLACDGLWDFLSENDVIDVVYNSIKENKGDRSQVSKNLVHAAKSLGSKDNISVVVAWLDMSTLENGHFPECRESAAAVDSVDDLLPPVLRSLKPATQASLTASQRLDKDAELWLKTLPWSYADALKQPAPKKEEQPAKSSPEQAKTAPEQAKTSPQPAVTTPEPAKTSPEVPKTSPAEPSKLPEMAEPAPKGEELGTEVGGEGDSGEDSDEGWNYVSVKENRQPNQHIKQELSEEDMESQLNPNAAEFVPTYGTKSPILDSNLTDIAHSPTRTSELRSLEKVKVPSAKEFLNEIAKRPSEIDELGENDKTVNGDLNNISTKAVYGDDSECLNATVDSSIIENESLKSTNPFASSQIPNFVQDHFSADFGFQQLNDSKSSNSEFEFIGGSIDSGVAESPLEVSAGLDVEERPCQDSPLLRESPEPSLLHNGEAEQEIVSPEEDVELCKLDEKEALSPEATPERTVSPIELTDEQPPPSSSIEIISLEQSSALPTLIPEPALSVDHGPETCVDSESEDDILVSPSKKESKVQLDEKCTAQLLAEEPELVEKCYTELLTEKPELDEECHAELLSEDPELDEKCNAELITEEPELSNDDYENLLRKQGFEIQEFVIEGITPSNFIAQHEQAMEGVLNNKENGENEVHATFEGSSISAEEVVLDQSPLQVLESTPMSAEQIILEHQSHSTIEENSSILESHEDFTLDQETVFEETNKPSDVVEITSVNEYIDESNESKVESVEICHKANEPEIVHQEEGMLENVLEQYEPEIRHKDDESEKISQKLDEEIQESVKEESDEAVEILYKQEPLDNLPIVNGIEHCSILTLHEERSSMGHEEKSTLNEIDHIQEYSVSTLPEKEKDFNEVDEYDVCSLKNKETSEIEEVTPENKEIPIGTEKTLTDLISEHLNDISESYSNQISEKIGEEEFILPIKKVICPRKIVNDVELNNEEENLTAENDRPSSPADFSKIGQDYPAQMPVVDILREELDTERDIVCEVALTESINKLNLVDVFATKTLKDEPIGDEILSFKNEENNIKTVKDDPIENELLSFKSEENPKTVEDEPIEEELLSLKNEENILNQVDEMSSSMIDYGEEKSLPEAQSNQLNLVQDLQFEVQDKNEQDTESDSGFEIINASEASTIEMEMRIQSEKEAGAIDEKLLLDKNEADVEEQTQTSLVEKESLIKEEKEVDEVKAEEAIVSAQLESVANGETVTPPATPPATPAPGFEVESKERLLSSAIAAAGITTVVAGAAAATAASVIAEPKVDDKKKPSSPKKAEPSGKPAPTAKPAAKTATAKTATSTKAAPIKAPSSATTKSSAAKPSSPVTKTASSTAKPAGPPSKPSTLTTKAAAKPGSKPSTPTAPKATPVLKSKPSTTAPPAKPAGTTQPKPAATKPSTTVQKKPPTPVSTTTKPLSSAGKPAAPAKPSAASTVNKPSAKPATNATKPAASSTTLKSAPPKPAATKVPATNSAHKPPTSNSRPSSAKSPTTSKPQVSSSATKTAPVKPTTGAAAKSLSAAKPTSTSSTKAPANAKTTAAPAKSASAKAPAPAAPLSKKPAAPTAIKKPAALTDKSVKEANNKLASAKTKKIEEKKIISKKEEIIETVEPLTQEPVITTTNGHISLIENGIPSPDIATEVN